METFAFIQSSVAYEDPGAEPQLRSLDDLNLSIPSSAWLGVAGSVAALTVMAGSPDSAHAAVRRGDTCPAVSTVQRALANVGRDPGSIDGAFGGKTEFAVIRFQQARGLAADGVVGASTASALGLNPNITCGAAGSPGGGTGGGSQLRVTVPALNVRSGPSLSSGVIDVLSSGQTVTVVGSAVNGWLPIGGGGWVSSSYVTAGGGTTPGGGTGGGGGRAIVRTNGSPLNVRSAPGSGTAVIDVIANGTVFNVAAVSGNWIQLPGGGWISGDWVDYL